MLVYRHSEYKKAQAKYSEVLDRKVELLKVNKQPRISMQKKNAAKKELQTLTAQSKILKKEVWQVRKLLMQIKSRPHTLSLRQAYPQWIRYEHGRAQLSELLGHLESKALTCMP